MVQTSPSEALADRPAVGGHHDDWRRADVVVGGFPCQDISFAGRGAGITGDRSSLWRWLCGAIRLVRPRYAIVENVAALLTRGLDTVCGDLAEIGYDTEWNCIPASHVGAPHRRDRIWIVAYPESGIRQREAQGEAGHAALGSEDVADTARIQQGRRPEQRAERERVGASGEPCDVADPNQPRLQGRLRHLLRERAGQRAVGPSGSQVPDADSGGQQERAQLDGDQAQAAADGSPCRRHSDGCGCADWWLTEPDVGRVANGVPTRVDRLKGLGNAVVPQIPEIIGAAIMNYERSPTSTPIDPR